MTMHHREHRDSVARGKGPIVLRVANEYGFHEHGTIAAAKAEAERLAEQVGGEFVVYVPLAIVRPAPKTVTTRIEVRDLIGYLNENDPFARAPERPF
jgi:hypothetical protein